MILGYQSYTTNNQDNSLFSVAAQGPLICITTSATKRNQSNLPLGIILHCYYLVDRDNNWITARICIRFHQRNVIFLFFSNFKCVLKNN